MVGCTPEVLMLCMSTIYDINMTVIRYMSYCHFGHIWHIWQWHIMVIIISIWVSKEALGPQECIHQLKVSPILFHKVKKRKTLVPNFSFVFSEISFVYFKSNVESEDLILSNKFWSFCVYMDHNNGIRVENK